MPEEQQKQPSEDALAEIERRLEALRKRPSNVSVNKVSSPHPIGRLMWLAFNIVSDLIAGVICGLGIGYVLDRWLGTRPVFIAVFLIMGSIAGVLNVVRLLRLYDERQRQRGESPQGKE